MKKLKQTLSVFLAVIMLLSSIPLMGLDDIFNMKADATTMKQTIASMSVGDTFTFGSYPQSDVTDTLGTKLTATAPSTGSWNSYNYYVNGKQSNYMKYYDLTYNGERRYRGVYFTRYRPSWTINSTSFSPDVYQDDNGYNTDTIYWFKYEPLTWRVLDPQTGYVICETIIDSQAFNNEYYTNGTETAYGWIAYYNDTSYQHYANNWEYSTIRQWLNETFYNVAFTSSERSQIPATVHTTPAYSTSYSEYDVGETTDYIFLPTYQDMINTEYGFSSDYSDWDITRRAHASAYAKAQGVFVHTYFADSYGENTSGYRLRSAGHNSNYATNVDYGGHVSYYYDTDDTLIGIRPALCFNPLSTGTPTTCTHTWNDGEITKEATCIETGKKIFTCTVCGETKQETVGKSGHKYTVFVEIATVTGNEPDYMAMKCEKCDATINVSLIGQTISEMSVGDTFTFGSYPQSDVTASLGATLTAAAPSTDSWNSYNYYISKVQLDYMKYYDLSYNGERYRGVYFTSYRPYCTISSTSTGNTYQDDNGYDKNTIYWFKYEPLTWRVLDPATGYVICETIIDSQAYNNEYYENAKNGKYYTDTSYQHYANNWEYSTIRQWLNSTFYTTAFSESERSQIPATVHITTAWGTSSSEYDVGETTDYIFLPTYQDMINTEYGFSSYYSDLDITRLAYASAYAKAQGVYVSSFTDSYGEYTSGYRLRSAGLDSYSTASVDSDCLVRYHRSTYDTDIGIRPALCFNPSSTEGVTHSLITVEGVSETCTENGYKTYKKCANCEYTEGYEVIKATHVLLDVAEKSATCSEDGYKAYKKCANCDYTEGYEVITATGHSLSDWTVISEATTEAEGLQTKVCSKCNLYVVTEIISKVEITKLEVKISESLKLKGENNIVILPGQKVSNIISSFNDGVVIKDTNGNEITTDTVIGSGFTVNLFDKAGNIVDTKTIIVLGDNDSDGKITAGDARQALRQSVNLEKFNDWKIAASKLAESEDNKITAADARIILRISVRLEQVEDIFKEVK